MVDGGGVVLAQSGSALPIADPGTRSLPCCSLVRSFGSIHSRNIHTTRHPPPTNPHLTTSLTLFETRWSHDGIKDHSFRHVHTPCEDGRRTGKQGWAKTYELDDVGTGYVREKDERVSETAAKHVRILILIREGGEGGKGVRAIGGSGQVTY